ncbi:hypothetical protein KAU51_03235 [Candidatus Parcubacteria bacterium]|nr:hypothetical protein [Candidatus Parcubacteria bacterium]
MAILRTILFLLTIFFFVFFLTGFCFAQELTYPEIGGEAPTADTTLPEYIKYIFNFSIILGAILASAVLVFGGIRWLLSAGSPTAIGEAKSWMFSGITGLVLLLGSYVILTAINPDLVIFGEMEPLKPANGVYLINNEGEKRYYASSVPSIKDFDIVSIEFISPSEELYSVFAYTEEEYKGSVTEIKNDGAGSTESTSGKSFHLFWNRPGVYLYEETDFGIDQRPPLHLSNSLTNIDDWDKKVKSIECREVPNERFYGVIPFSEQGFMGKCSLIYNQDISDLTQSSGSNNEPPIGYDVSSIIVFSLDVNNKPSGDITFYDSIECKGKKYVVDGPAEVTGLSIAEDPDNYKFEEDSIYRYKFSHSEEPLDENIMSLEINATNGNFGVVLITEPQYPADINNPGVCQFFKKPKGTTCIPTLKGTSVYDPEPDGVKIRSILIFPLTD